MSIQRRCLLATTALIAVGAAVSSCALSTGGAGTIANIVNTIQGALSFIGPIVPLIVTFIPGASVYEQGAQSALLAASSIFNTITLTVTAVQAQPLVGQINASLNGAITIAQKAAALITDPAQKIRVDSILAEAQNLIGVIGQFVQNTATIITPKFTSTPMPVHTFIHPGF